MYMNDFSNQPETFYYLKKRQESDCHLFQMKLKRLCEFVPDDKELAYYSSYASYWPYSLISSSLLLSSKSLMLLLKKYSSFDIKYDEMIDSKKVYESAGGKYE
jgi:hypothetical protein